jgi:hypothetical protein
MGRTRRVRHFVTKQEADANAAKYGGRLKRLHALEEQIMRPEFSGLSEDEQKRLASDYFGLLKALKAEIPRGVFVRIAGLVSRKQLSKPRFSRLPGRHQV